MRKILFIILLGLTANYVKAQTFAEWFRQKKTQKKYLLQQIAGLQLYISYLKKGYAIAPKGLTTIGDIKNGTLHLHDDYFQSLKSVNSGIKKDPKAAKALILQEQILQNCRQIENGINGSTAFTAGEKDYILEVTGRLAAESMAVLDELEMVVTKGRLEMKDDERLQRIDALYDKLLVQYRFSKQFSSEIILLAGQRQKEQNNIKISRALHGFKNG